MYKVKLVKIESTFKYAILKRIKGNLWLELDETYSSLSQANEALTSLVLGE